MIIKDVSNHLSQDTSKNEEDTIDSKIDKTGTNKKMLTMDPKLIKEMQEYADKWAAGSFSSFVAMMFQIFKNNMESDKNK